MGYASKDGYPVLEERVRKLIKQSTGLYYKHIVLTSGAQIGIVAGLKALSQKYHQDLVHYDELYFLGYPQIAKELGLMNVNKDWYKSDSENILRLTASPSNPTGEINFDLNNRDKTIWDACYHNEIYTSPVASEHLAKPDHVLAVGSFGKLTGLNGLRLGWIATNDEYLKKQTQLIHYNLTLGVSTISLGILENFLDNVPTNSFFLKANSYLNDNRTEMAKLDHIFSTPIPKYGMFWLVEVDNKSRKLLDNLHIKYIEGTECGASEDMVRLTLGQNRDITKKMVETVLKEDSRG